MARHNLVTINARVLANPTIIINNETGEYKQGFCWVATIRNDRDNGLDDDTFKFDRPLILTGNPEIIKNMETWKQNDIVEIKGAVTTKDVIKKPRCPICSEKNSQEGVLDFVSPIFTSVRKTNLSEEESIDELDRLREISNNVILMGYLTGPVKYYHPEGDKYRTSSYQIAVNRKYFLKDDYADVRTDYPYIRTFGQQAKLDHICLDQSSLILVDGYIQTKEYTKRIQCKHCNEFFDWNDNSIEIIGNSIEYLQNFLTPEEVEAQKEQQANDIKASLGF